MPMSRRVRCLRPFCCEGNIVVFAVFEQTLAVENGGIAVSAVLG
jgi:hypothetical protein